MAIAQRSAPPVIQRIGIRLNGLRQTRHRCRRRLRRLTASARGFSFGGTRLSDTCNALAVHIRGLGERLIISFRQHAKHHQPPYVRNYCIAIGWLNPLLEGIRFWRGLEWLIWKLTGAVPREDDLGREAALALMRARD